MIYLSRTPLRVSFFGGGTDYPEYFQRRPGAVIGMAIDKYVYISALRLMNVVDYRYRLSYSRIESAQHASEIEHPVVREILRYFEVDEALDISVSADLPARSGLGSSSSFTVGFLNLVHALKDQPITKFDLSKKATFVERELLKERVGVQDQLHASFGGINRFDFVDGRTHITPVQLTGECQTALVDSLVLVYTGLNRYASETLTTQIAATKTGQLDNDLHHLLTLADQCVGVLEGTDPQRMIREFGQMMHDGWCTKKRLSKQISNPQIDALYDEARQAGALGGKLCGAGNGGFLLMVLPPELKKNFTAKINHGKVIPIGLDTQGSVILRG